MINEADELTKAMGYAIRAARHALNVLEDRCTVEAQKITGNTKTNIYLWLGTEGCTIYFEGTWVAEQFQETVSKRMWDLFEATLGNEFMARSGPPDFYEQEKYPDLPTE